MHRDHAVRDAPIEFPILVNDVRSKSTDSFPVDARVTGFQLAAELPTRFRDDDQLPVHRIDMDLFFQFRLWPVFGLVPGDGVYGRDNILGITGIVPCRIGQSGIVFPREIDAATSSRANLSTKTSTPTPSSSSNSTDSPAEFMNCWPAD